MRVSESKVRKLLRELMSNGSLTWSTYGDVGTFSPIDANDVVDPSAAVTTPDNPNYVPTDRTELKTAMSSMIDDLPNDRAADAYKALKDTLSDMSDDKHSEDDNMDKKNNTVEEAIRKVIRKMISEAGPYRDTGMSYSGPMTGSDVKAGFTECEACEGEGYTSGGKVCDACKGKGAIPSRSRKNVMMGDVGGASFKEISAEMGWGPESAAKQAVTRILGKMKYRMNIDPGELEIATLTAMNDYIEMLRKSGELTAADVQLMKDHPSIIGGLEGFREYLDKVLTKSQKLADKAAAAEGE